jgi:starch-binding outer membrane protein SusE/F
MKKILIFFPVLIAALLIAGCEKEGELATLKSSLTNPVLSVPASGANLIMTKPEAAEELTFTWNAADYGVPLGILYTLQIDKEGNGFASPVDVISVNDITTTITYGDFNSKLVALEALMEQVNACVLRIKASVPKSSAEVIYSDSIRMNVTPYTAKDHIYMVGQHNGWNNNTANTMNRNLPGLKYELYLDLTAVDQGFKILPTLGSWDGDIGEDPSNPGHLISSGENNMFVPTTGYWKINVDIQAMTWSKLKTTWGIIGGFPGNSWGSDYATMTYDAPNGVWTATFTTTAAAEFKFRANADWGLNYGDNGADGGLDEGGSNLSVSVAGNYTVTMNLNPTGNPQRYTYTITKL